jgi:hypothetical protein
MDFEDAAQRLKRDQKKLRRRPELAISQKAKQQAEYQRKQRERLQQQREQQRRLADYQQHYMHSCDRALHVQKISSNLYGTSIHGAGDKITLPPSVLQLLTSSEMEGNNNVGNPWTFRIGILNPEYNNFPMSPLIQTLKPPRTDEDDSMRNDDDDSDDENDQQQHMAAYMDELSHKYLSYTHCTVVEFTQEEGYVGIPQPIALALLDSKNNSISSTRTVDPAQAATKDDKDAIMRIILMTTTTTTTTTTLLLHHHLRRKNKPLDTWHGVPLTFPTFPSKSHWSNSQKAAVAPWCLPKRQYNTIFMVSRMSNWSWNSPSFELERPCRWGMSSAVGIEGLSLI